MASQSMYEPLLQSIEKRIRSVESLIGPGFDPKDVFPDLPSNLTICSQLYVLKEKIDALMTKDIELLSEKVKKMDVILKADQGQLCDILLLNSNKQACVLEQSDFLRGCANSMRELHTLKDFINAPSLQDQEKCIQRLETIEYQGSILAEGAQTLLEEVSLLTKEYADAVNIISSALVRWDEKLAELERKKRNKKRQEMEEADLHQLELV